MAGRPQIAFAAAALLAAGGIVSGCGSKGIEVSKSDSAYHGAKLFADHCGGCHTLDATGSQGSTTKIKDRERVDGPNFNTRKEQVDQILYAIRNGGFSGAIMPENIVVGADAQAIAQFLAEYSGKLAKSGPASPGG